MYKREAAASVVAKVDLNEKNLKVARVKSLFCRERILSFDISLL